MKTKLILIFSIIFISLQVVSAQSEAKKAKNPVIVIPGIMGSKLVNQKTNETVWVKLSDSKTDDLALPVSPDLAGNKDDLIATDIVESIKVARFLPSYSIYDDLLEYLEKKGGYQRGDWENPKAGGDQDTYYVFAYDWRRDNVESAHLLFQKIEKLKAKLKRTDLKFDVLAHSMGGLITRYAAMYGASDLRDKPAPTWVGAKHFNNIFLMGTPNEGSMEALEALVNGSSVSIPIAGRFYPSFFDREVGFTLPSIYQLMPHGDSAKFYDENLKPWKLDIYDPKTWQKFGWTITSEASYMDKLDKAKQGLAERYFEAVLLRAKRFHAALNAKTTIPGSLKFFLLGSDCKNTLDGAVVYFDSAKNKWKTVTRGEGFKTQQGEKVSEKLVKQTIFGKGDGTVPLRSLLAKGQNGQSLFSTDPNSQVIVCELHTAIQNNKTIQENFLSILSANGNTKLWGN